MGVDWLTSKKILVTGASGFVGRHVVARLADSGYDVMATSRSLPEELREAWGDRVRYIPYDLDSPDVDPVQTLGVPDVLIHLAWPGLRDCRDMMHFEVFLPESYDFIKRMVKGGTQRVVVAGTCFEYGRQYGPLREDAPVFPDNAYGLAKDTLRRYLQSLQSHQAFSLAWVRLFYMHGFGQHPQCIMAQLDAAIDQGLPEFNMSMGEQLRDYLPIEEVARRLVLITERSDVDGIINCCNGEPISIRRLVENRIAERGASIKPNLGYYPYPDYEPMAFWGCPDKYLDIQRHEPHD